MLRRDRDRALKRLSRRDSDSGVILPIVLVVVVVLAVVIIAVATYTTTTLRYGQVVERSADRLATANGAMDNLLEEIERGKSLCTLTTLANTGYEYDLLDPAAAVPAINGVNPRVRCQTIGGPITGVENFALILTGDPGTGVRSGALLTLDGSSTPRKVISGPVYMAQRPNSSDTLDIKAAFTIENGDLLYSRPTCPAPDVSVPLYPSPPHDLLITPQGFGVVCLEAPNWNALFGSARPSEAAVTPLAPAPAPDNTTVPGCRIFSPGKYTAPPALAAYNYFKSGNYYFENVGKWTIANQYALMGYPGAAGPGIPGKGNDTISNNTCVDAWTVHEPDTGGATLYLGGTSRIEVANNGALEVSGRDQAGQFVAIHALGVAGVPSTIQGDDPVGPLPFPTRLIQLDPGGNKQISIQGLLWAPFASVQFDNVSNQAVAALTGGAVVSEIFLQAPASATNFLIGSGGSPGTNQLELTTTATNDNGAATRVRAIITYRGNDVALESRRVMCLTPGDPDPTTCP